MLWALRGAFLLQALLGIGLSRAFLGMRSLGAPSGEGDMHMLIGTIAAVLAIIVLKPEPGDENPSMVTLARFFPLVPLAAGLMVWPRLGIGMSSAEFVILHIVLGIAAIGLVEMTVARRRRRAL